ncbi:MAG: hypothetical protein QXO75_03415 [Nitrososphaerota archaeon]
MKTIKKLEEELNETSNLKRTFPEFPISIKFPENIVRNGWGIFYQKNTGFRIWGPNHYTRASAVLFICPSVGQYNAPFDPNIRVENSQPSWKVTYWNIYVGQGTGVTTKSDIVLKDTSPIQANSGTSARVEGDTYWQRQYSAVYNANVFPSGYVIREVGLFMKNETETTFAGQSFAGNTEYMVARLSSSDGDFNPYTPNITLPLTVNWIIQWSI